MPQTKFVLGKALAQGLRPIVAINKIDRPDERHLEVLEEIFDLFVALDATPEQLDFPVLYGSAKQWLDGDGARWQPRTAWRRCSTRSSSMCPPPKVEDGPFRMLVTTIERNPFLGRMLTGRIFSGTVKAGDPIHCAEPRRQGSREGPHQQGAGVPRPRAHAGRRGRSRRHRRHRRARDLDRRRHPDHPVESTSRCRASRSIRRRCRSPSASTTARSPAARATRSQSRVIRERLLREAEGNVAIRVTEGTDIDSFEVAGRGELQLAVLIENMRREGFELTIGRPRVVLREEDGQKLEPIEEVIIDVDDEHSGIVVQKLTERKGDLVDMRPSGDGRTRLRFYVPTRSLIGYQPELLTRHPRHGDLQPPVPRVPAVQGRPARPAHRRADLERRRRSRWPTPCGTSKSAGR